LVYVGANFEVRWRRVDWSMDLPTIFVDDQKISFDLPNVSMGRQDISFDMPTTRNERRRGPDYPEFKCEGFDCRITWSPSYFDVPVIVMETQHLSMDLPEVRMETQEIVLGVPQIKMETQHFSFDIPEFVLKDIQHEAAEAKKKGEALQQDTQNKISGAKAGFAASAQQQTGAEFSAFVDCQTHYLSEQLIQGIGQFDSAARTIQGFIDGLHGQKVPDDNPQLKTLFDNLNLTIAKRNAFDEKITAQLKALPGLHETFVKNLLGQ
jgi:hypothetical protein